MYNAKLILALCALIFCNCQSAIRIKPEELAKTIDNPHEYSLSSKQENFTLADLYANKKGLVLIFWQSSCPCVKRYQERISELADRYNPQGIAFRYISSNKNESFVHALSEYEKRQSLLPLLRDEGGHLAHALGVKSTPSVVLIDPHGKKLFIGWIDDERLPRERGRRAYLDKALEQYLAGKPISRPTSPMFGCPIR